MLEQADRLCIHIARIRPEPCGASPENVVERIGMLGPPGGLRRDQLDAERVGEAARDLVLQGEQIAVSRSNRSVQRCASVAASIS